MPLDSIPMSPFNMVDASTSYIGNTNLIGRSAVLYLFTPKNIVDQYRRAHLYKFSPNFMFDLQDTIANNRESGQNITMSSYMTHSPNANQVVLPNALGTPINTQAIRDVWTFILIIDNDKDPTAPQSNYVQSRAFYSGYCTDEPISQGFNGQEPQPNPIAMLIVTHRFSINKPISMGYNGVAVQTHVSSNVDILPVDHIFRSVNNMNVYDLHPGNLNRCISTGYDGNSLLMLGDHGLLQYDTGNTNPQRVASLSSPRHHMHRISNDIQKAMVEGNPFIGENEDAMSLLGGGQALQLNAFDSNISATSVSSLYGGLQGNVPISMGELLNRYPDIDIKDIREQFNNPWSDNVVSQAAPNNQTVAYSLVTSTVPYLLTENKLVDVAFRYCSYFKDGLGSEPGGDELYRASGVVQMTNEQLYANYKMVINALKLLLIPTLRELGGEFDLLMECSVAGPCIVYLKFCDNYVGNENGYYETNNKWSGLLNPLVGTIDEYNSNASELASLKQAVLEVPNYRNMYNPMNPEGL